MNKLWVTCALLMITPNIGASDIPHQPHSITTISLKSMTGQIRSIDIAASDSISIVYSKIAREFAWNSHPIIYCCNTIHCLSLALDMTDIFFDTWGKLLPDGRPRKCKPRILCFTHTLKNLYEAPTYQQR